jgi:hypothetical protein
LRVLRVKYSVFRVEGLRISVEGLQGQSGVEGLGFQCQSGVGGLGLRVCRVNQGLRGQGLRFRILRVKDSGPRALQGRFQDFES